jgi:hypothetical protein
LLQCRPAAEVAAVVAAQTVVEVEPVRVAEEAPAAEVVPVAEIAAATRATAQREAARVYHDIPQARPMAAAIAYALHAPTLLAAEPVAAAEDAPEAPAAPPAAGPASSDVTQDAANP